MLSMAKRKAIRTMEPPRELREKLHIMALGTDSAARLTSSDRYEAQSDTREVLKKGDQDRKYIRIRK